MNKNKKESVFLSRVGSSDYAAGTLGPVLIIGVGLIGGSIGLALRREGVEVLLRDVSPTAVSLAVSLGAGIMHNDSSPEPRIVLVATPPDVTADVVVSALREFPDSLVMDVASVKTPIVEEVLRAAHTEASRYCSVHPMAGKEVNGVGSASADLFIGRPWVVVAQDNSSSEAVLAARIMGTDVGAFLVGLSVEDHDKAVALVSHVPQLVSSLMGSLLMDAPVQALELSGGGLRDVTRVAASDPRLWNAILAGNAPAVVEVLHRFKDSLEELLTGLSDASQDSYLSDSALRGDSNSVWSSAAVGAINRVMIQGNEGVARIPGKHGDAASRYGVVSVLVPDEPGFLGRLFQEIGSAGVNVEDLRLEHSLGQAQGLANIYVIPASVEPLLEHLRELGWSVATL